jgi:hypothetical protein
MIDLTDLIKHQLRLGISGHALPGLVNLGLGLKQERLHPPFGEATIEIKERSVLGTLGVASALGLAAFEKSLNQGGVQEFGRKLKRAQQMSLALAQGQGGSPLEGMYPTHI